MKHILTASVFALGSVFGLMSVANAGPITTPTLSLKLIESGYTTVTRTSTIGSVSYTKSFGTWTTNIVGGLDTGTIALPGIDLSAQDSTTKGKALTIELTELGLTQPLGMIDIEGFISQTPLSLASTNFSVYASNTDKAFATTDEIGTAVLAGKSSSSISFTSPFDTTGPYSITEILTLVPGESGGSGSIDASVSVPEPGSLALLGTGLVGLGLILRRRQKRA